MTCRSPIIHIEVDPKGQPLLYQETSWSWAGLNQWTSPNLDYTRVALHHSARGEHKDLSQPILGHLHNLLEGLHKITFSKPSRERQLPRVTSWWRLLKDFLVPQSSNSWRTTLECFYSHKDAISKQRVSEREREREETCSNMLMKLSNGPRHLQQGACISWTMDHSTSTRNTAISFYPWEYKGCHL